MNHSVTSQLKSKLDDLQFLEDELEATKTDLRQRDEMVRDLTKDNERLQAQLERAMEKADKLQAYAVSLTTRLQIISDNVDSVIREASRSAVAEAGHVKVRRHKQEGTAGTDMVNRLPANEYR